MFETAVKGAAGEMAECVLTMLRHAKVTSIGDIDDLPSRTGTVLVCGINVNVLVVKIKEEYRKLSVPREPDEFDDLDIPGAMMKYIDIVRSSGITTISGLLEAGVSGLSSLDGIGNKTASALIDLVSPVKSEQGEEDNG